MTRVITELAPAKLNLALSVGRPTETGLHPICSWMVSVNLMDELELCALPTGSLSRFAIFWHDEARRRSDIDWPIRTDLAVKAHLAMQQHVGRELPLQMKLAKRIPVGGGLGGGSSDAAAMLRAVNRLYELDLTPAELARIGAAIGSDVSFLLAGGSAMVRGTGEDIEQHEQTPKLHAVIVMPEQPCNTAAVYAAFDEATGGSASLREAEVLRLRDMTSADALSAHLFNDLGEAAQVVVPELRAYRSAVSEVAERPAHITGSGSTLFIICDDPLHAEALAGAIEQRLNLPAVAVNVIEPAHEPTVH